MNEVYTDLERAPKEKTKEVRLWNWLQKNQSHFGFNNTINIRAVYDYVTKYYK